MKRNSIQKLVAFILTIIMLVGMMPTISFATTSDEGDITNETNGKTFTLRKDHYELLRNHSLYGTKDYLAYQWENVFFIWFFNDDLTDVQFSMWNRGNNNFGLYPSKKVSYTQYMYNKNTLEPMEEKEGTINTSNAFNYSYNFIASFNIYTDKTYTAYFYRTKDSGENDDEPLVTFEPLEPKKAKDFLRFITQVDGLNEKELPEYYNFLIGNIQDPEEELKTKVSFLTFLYYCFDLQLAKYDQRINMGTTYLLKWVGDNPDKSNIIYSEVKDIISDVLKEIIAKGQTVPVMEIKGIDIVTEVLDYGDLLIVLLGEIEAIQKRDVSMYIMAYKQLLEAKAANDEIAIQLAESNCDIVRLNVTFGLGISEEMCEEFARYIFNIEQSLPK